MKKILLILFTISIILVGCGDVPDEKSEEISQESGVKPKGVSQEFWHESNQLSILIKDVIKNDRDLPKGIGEKIVELSEKGTSEENEFIINKVRYYFMDSQMLLSNTFPYAQKKEYDESYKKIVEVFGESNLSIQKLDENYEVSLFVDARQNELKNETHYTSPYEPQIGMTADDIINSTWGKPTDINTTTTEYSTSEQWVYSNYQYLYFDDGILTSIQQ